MRQIGWAAAVVFVVGCGEDGAAIPAGASTTPTATATGSVHGVIDGDPFTPISGYAHVSESGSVDLVFGSEKDACATSMAGKITAGARYVSIYSGERTIEAAPGTYRTSDSKLLSIASSCSAGTPLSSESALFYHSFSKSGEGNVTLTRVTESLVEGSLSIPYEDGTSFEGSFSLPTCAAVIDRHFVCR